MRILLIVLLIVCPAGLARAQEVPRDTYLRQLPLSNPRLGPQTAASAALALFGDPADPDYRDVAPVDGIDDRRHGILQALAVRFAPFLVQNTTNLPVRFKTYIENRPTFPLTVDHWDLAQEEPRRTGATTVNLSVLGRAACDPALIDRAAVEHPDATADPVIEDCKLLGLLQRYGPGTGDLRPVDESRIRATPSPFDVLFLNFPGDGPKSWEVNYRPEYERTPNAMQGQFPHAYVHPFVLDASGGFELALQYWFFYPTNDSGMDHEGDWEHLNVLVAPRSMVGTPLDERTLRRILSGEIGVTGSEPDPLVISRADYYFHDRVMPLDFGHPNVYLPRDEWRAQVRAMAQTRFREAEIWNLLRTMVWEDDAETILNTHPFGYIGSDNKGLNQLLEPPGGSNRNSHGTFPFPGRYNNVGPGGSTDQIANHLDSRAYLRDLRAGRAGMGPDFRRGSVIGLADEARLTVVPDWERLVTLARDEAAVRAEWAWLLLPLHWGYPATVSPFAGVLEHFNTGNVAPVGPSFSTGWNQSGPTSSFKLFDPHTFPEILPLQLQDNFRNDLGFLNLTLPTFANLPPFDFLTRAVAYPVRKLLGRSEPVFYPSDSLPFRFVGVSTGVSVQKFSDDFSALAFHPSQFEAFGASLISHVLLNGGDDTTSVVGGGDFMNSAVGPFVEVPFYIGSKFVSENLVRNARAAFGADLQFSNIPPYRYDADINMWEYAGSLRYNILTSSLQPYLKAGYGWSWYRLERVRVNQAPLTPSATPWIKPGVLPNVLHYGLGAEWIPWKRFGGLPGGLEASLRFEYVRYTQRLDLDLSEIPLSEIQLFFTSIGDVPSSTRVTRQSFLFGLTVSF